MVMFVLYCDDHGKVDPHSNNKNYCPSCGKQLRSVSETLAATMPQKEEKEEALEKRKTVA